MPRKPISIRMTEDTIKWLTRNGKPLAHQLREDLRALRLLKGMQDLEVSLGKALEIAEKS